VGAVGRSATDDVRDMAAVAAVVDRFGSWAMGGLVGVPFHVSPTKSKPPFTFGAATTRRRNVDTACRALA